MFMRNLKTFFGVIIYILFFSLALVPILAIRANIESIHYSIAVSIWAFGTALFFFPALSIIIKRVWLFETNSEPVPEDRLKGILLEVNDYGCPIQVRKSKSKLVASWNYHEQSWCELLEKTGKKRMYELWLDFDNASKTVFMTDKYRSTDWKLSPIKVTTGWFAYSKPYFKVATGEEWGVDNYVDSSPEDYNFAPKEIKSPFLNTILKNGWSVRFSLF